MRHIDSPLLIVWDRRPAHRSRLVREFIAALEGHLAMEYVPPYSRSWTRWNTSGATGNNTSCRMSVRKITGKTSTPGGRCAACAADHG